jgi:hypothetical protein
MTMFASRENSPAEQRALLAAIIETFDAVEIVKTTGLERARELAQRTVDQREAETPGPEPEQGELWAA